MNSLSGTTQEILARRDAVWKWSKSFPIPIVPMKCPFCDGEYGIREWRSKIAEPRNVHHRVPFRIDVTMKCDHYGNVQQFGVPVMYRPQWDHVHNASSGYRNKV